MRVCSQVTEHLVGAAEGWFGVDHPAVAEDLAEKTAEDFGLRQGLELLAASQRSGRSDRYHAASQHAGVDWLHGR